MSFQEEWEEAKMRNHKKIKEKIFKGERLDFVDKGTAKREGWI